jgi:2'-5' RNA ligase
VSGAGGHSVLAVPVPPLDDVVRETTDAYDASFVSTDPAFVHAHITALGPWLASPTEDELAVVGEIAAATPPFEYRLAELGQFPNGVIHLLPEPADPFIALTARLVAAFPQCPPYEGRFAELVPHLTLDMASAAVDVAGVRDRLGNRVPVAATADRLDLQWWDNHDCHVRRSWRLGG